jgi:hypothetical protein
MVSVVVDELMAGCCELCVKKSTVLGTYTHKKIRVGAAHFFNCSLDDLEVSFIIKYLYLTCRA